VSEVDPVWVLDPVPVLVCVDEELPVIVIVVLGVPYELGVLEGVLEGVAVKVVVEVLDQAVPVTLGLPVIEAVIV
jgi:hypothetical protein